MASRTSREQFNRQAPHYNAQWNAWNELSLEWLIERARCRPEHRILDVATGTGFTALAFAPLVAHVTGIDVSEGMLGEAREKARLAGSGNTAFLNGAAESIPFPSESFDGVVCRVAAHHFLSVPRFLREAHRVLRPGGRLLVADTSVPDNAPVVDAWQQEVEVLRDPSHVRNYSPSEWKSLAEDAGFLVEEVEIVRESALISLDPWLEKAGCTGETATRVRTLFTDAPPEAVEAFSVVGTGDGRIAFQWQRVALSASRR